VGSTARRSQCAPGVVLFLLLRQAIMISAEMALMEVQRRRAGMCHQCGNVKTHKINLGVRRRLVREIDLFAFFSAGGNISPGGMGRGQIMGGVSCSDVPVDTLRLLIRQRICTSEPSNTQRLGFRNACLGLILVSYASLIPHLSSVSTRIVIYGHNVYSRFRNRCIEESAFLAMQSLNRKQYWIIEAT
jgi:hypothetical protein